MPEPAVEAIYVRQSKDKKDSVSIESQIDFCKRQCECPERAQIYVDRGFSGKNTQRPDFRRLMRDVEAGKIARIVIYRLDRLSRSIVDFSRIWERLDQHHVEFVSVNEKFDTTTPMGKAMIYIIMIFAQLERETIGERVRDNYYARIRYGSWPGGPAPYGFHNAKIINEEGKHIPTLVESEEIEVVERIFHTYAAQDISLSKLGAQLTEDGIRCGRRNGWDNTALVRILRSPVYVQADESIYLYYESKGVQYFSNAKQAFDGTTSAHLVGRRDANTRKYRNDTDHVLSLTNFPGRIPSHIWLRCQRRLDENRQVGNAGKGKHSWLSGLLGCGACGYSLSIVCSGEKRYFACSGRRNLHVCEKKSFALKPLEVEQAVEQRLNALLDDLSGDETGIQETQEEVRRQQELEQLEDRIQMLVHRLSLAGDVSMEYINRELARLDQQKQGLMTSLLGYCRRQLPGICFSALSFEEKKLAAQMFLARILVNDDGIELIWKS